MNLSELLNRGLVEKFQSDSAQIKNEADIAKRDLAAAKKIFDIGEWEWAHAVAYNAMLQAGRALMFSKGYRPAGGEHHLAVISFVHAVYSAKFPPEILEAFDKARRRRNESIYDKAGSISESQAKNLVEKADFFVKKSLEILSLG